MEAWRSGVLRQSLQTAVLLHSRNTLPCPPRIRNPSSGRVHSPMLLLFCCIAALLQPPRRRGSGTIKFLLGLGLGAGGWGWVLVGWTGLVLSATAHNPARLVYGSAALVASLRGQHCHYATLPTNTGLTVFGAGTRPGPAKHSPTIRLRGQKLTTTPTPKYVVGKCLRCWGPKLLGHAKGGLRAAS